MAHLQGEGVEVVERRRATVGVPSLMPPGESHFQHQSRHVRHGGSHHVGSFTPGFRVDQPQPDDLVS